MLYQELLNQGVYAPVLQAQKSEDVKLIRWTRALRDRKPPRTPKFETKVIRDSNSDFRTNPYPDVRRICPKMLWMHYLVGVSHFAKYETNRLFIVWEMLTNVQKSSIPQWWRKRKSDPESKCRSGSPPKVLEGHLSPAPAKFGRRLFPRSSVILFTE